MYKVIKTYLPLLVKYNVKILINCSDVSFDVGMLDMINLGQWR